MPAFKSFKETLLSSLKDLSGSLPDSRRHTTENIARRIADLCETNYKLHATSFPKHVYTPYLQKQTRKLPPGPVMGVFDKGPMVANFACPFAWHYTMHAILRDSALFKELITFAHFTDAKCWLLWQLSDSLALTLTGAYCGYSILMNRTPLKPMDAAKAFKTYRTYPPSSALRRLGQPMQKAQNRLTVPGHADWPTHPGHTHPARAPRPRQNGRIIPDLVTRTPAAHRTHPHQNHRAQPCAPCNSAQPQAPADAENQVITPLAHHIY